MPKCHLPFTPAVLGGAMFSLERASKSAFVGLIVLGFGSGCAAQKANEGAQLNELSEKIRLLESERDRHAARIAALEAMQGAAQAAASPQRPVTVEDRPLLRVVRLEPNVKADAPAAAEPSPSAEANAGDSEHVLLSGTGSELRAETLSETAPGKAKP